MDLIVNKMGKFKEVHITDGYGVIERLPGTSVIKLAFAVLTQTGFFKAFCDIAFMSAVKNRGHYLPAKCLCGIAKVNFKHLSDIHTRRNAQRIKNNVKRSSVRQERHILLRKNARDNTLVTMTAGHLITNGNLTLLGDIAADNHVYTRVQLLAVFFCKHLDINNDAVLAMRYAQRCVADFTCFFTENGA